MDRWREDFVVLRQPRWSVTVTAMSPIDEFQINRLTRELEAHGIHPSNVWVQCIGADDWRFRVTIEGRDFEFGFNQRDQFWCREETVGNKKDFVSNDVPRICTAADARTAAIRLLRRAVLDPTFVVRDPPVI